jgi:hypothetical protein
LLINHQSLSHSRQHDAATRLEACKNLKTLPGFILNHSSNIYKIWLVKSTESLIISLFIIFALQC